MRLTFHYAKVVTAPYFFQHILVHRYSFMGVIYSLRNWALAALVPSTRLAIRSVQMHWLPSKKSVWEDFHQCR